MPLFLHQMCSSFIAIWRFLSMASWEVWTSYNVVSSAYISVETLLVYKGKSFMKSKNKRGPRIKTGLSPPVFLYWPFQGGTFVVVPYCSCCLCLYFGSSIMLVSYLGKSCSFCLPRVPFVNCRQFMYLVISLLVLRAGYGIWLYQFLIIAYLFTLLSLVEHCMIQVLN